MAEVPRNISSQVINQDTQPTLEVKTAGDKARTVIIYLAGSWRLQNLTQAIKCLKKVKLDSNLIVKLDGSALEQIDTTGAMVLFQHLLQDRVDLGSIQIQNFGDKQKNILTLVVEKITDKSEITSPTLPNLIQSVGEGTMIFYQHMLSILNFLGQASYQAIRILINPRLFRVREFFVQLELSCLHAIPIVCLVAGLVGLVIAHLFSLQTEKYGANIFIVDAVALAMCRELSPLIVAIIIAGRSGSSYTAQIGTMKLNDEIDAITTLGLSPMQVLTLPRILALIISLPLLVFVGDIVGIWGGMIVADNNLGITYMTFIQRLNIVLPPTAVFVGLIKAPVFAAFIAVIGCRMGFAVEKNARSVGINTTSTVVQSIVSVILLNAAFAIIFTKLGI